MVSLIIAKSLFLQVQRKLFLHDAMIRDQAWFRETLKDGTCSPSLHRNFLSVRKNHADFAGGIFRKKRTLFSINILFQKSCVFISTNIKPVICCRTLYNYLI